MLNLLLIKTISYTLTTCLTNTSGAAQIGIMKFDCMLGDDLNAMLSACSTIENLYDTRRRFIVSVTLDVLTDFCGKFNLLYYFLSQLTF